jgi:hypothetical protein
VSRDSIIRLKLVANPKHKSHPKAVLKRLRAAAKTVERLAAEVGVADRLHLWPDKSLGNVGVANRMPKPQEYLRWLRKSWSRVSEWSK